MTGNYKFPFSGNIWPPAILIFNGEFKKSNRFIKFSKPILTLVSPVPVTVIAFKSNFYD